MSRNIRSLCNTTHSNERYVPITGYRRHNCTRTKYVNSLGHHSVNWFHIESSLPLLHATASATTGYNVETAQINNLQCSSLESRTQLPFLFVPMGIGKVGRGETIVYLWIFTHSLFLNLSNFKNFSIFST